MHEGEEATRGSQWIFRCAQHDRHDGIEIVLFTLMEPVAALVFTYILFFLYQSVSLGEKD